MRFSQIPSEGWGLLIFFIQYVTGIVVFSTVRPWQTIASPWELIAATIVIAAANSFVIVEGVKMLAESFLRKREEQGRREGKAQAHEEWLKWWAEVEKAMKDMDLKIPPRPSLEDEDNTN